MSDMVVFGLFVCSQILGTPKKKTKNCLELLIKFPSLFSRKLLLNKYCTAISLLSKPQI